MKTLLAILTALLPTLAFAGSVNSLCLANEKLVFSCATNAGKHISVCTKGKVVQYRFGRPEKLELEYPKVESFKPSTFQYFHYFRPEENRTSLQFETNEAEYNVFSDSEGATKSAGVVVKTKATAREISLQCKGNASANWFEIEGKVKCSDEPMNTCQ